eukprot:PhM_4_TR15703/c3_g1_i3/m.85058
MPYNRALDWVQRWEANVMMEEDGISLDMRETYDDSEDTFNGFTNISHISLVELTLPSMINATRIGQYFLCGCDHLTFLNTSCLTNVSEIGDGFLYLCSALTSVDLSPLVNTTRIGRYFLC